MVAYIISHPNISLLLLNLAPILEPGLFVKLSTPVQRSLSCLPAVHISECRVPHGHHTRHHTTRPQVADELADLSVAGVHGVQHSVAVVLGEKTEWSKNIMWMCDTVSVLKIFFFDWFYY